MKSNFVRQIIMVIIVLLLLPAGEMNQASAVDRTDSLLLLISDGDVLYTLEPGDGDLRIIGSGAGSVALKDYLATNQGVLRQAQESPIATFVSKDYFFYQGIGNLEKRKVVYTEVPIMEGIYQVWVAQDGQQQKVLPAGEIDLPDAGQLVPVAWIDDDIYFDTVLAYLPFAHFGLWKFNLTTKALTNVTMPEVTYYDQLLPTPDGTRLVARARDSLTCTNTDEASASRYQSHEAQDTKLVVFNLASHESQIIESVSKDSTIVGWITSSQAEKLADRLATEGALPDTVNPFLYWPLPDSFRDIVGYPGSYPGHLGTDIDVNNDGTTPIYASHNGTVVALCNNEPDGYYRNINSCNGAGNYVRLVDDANGYYTMYYHLKQGSVTVSSGTHVSAGQLLGYAYNSGYTCGYESAATGCMGYPGSYSHLHFEVWGTCGSTTCWVNPWDPYIWIGNPPSIPSTCCGCLPANCCYGAMAQAGSSSNGFKWTDSGLSNPAASMPCTVSERRETIDATGPTTPPEMEESVDPMDGPVSWDDEPPITTSASMTEPTRVLPEDPIDSPAIASIPVQRTPVEPQRTPPTSTNYRIPKSVFGSGGGPKTSTHYLLNSTQGQSTDLSRRTSSSYVLTPGYWSRWTPGNVGYTVYLPLALKNQ